MAFWASQLKHALKLKQRALVGSPVHTLLSASVHRVTHTLRDIVMSASQDYFSK